MEKKKLSYRLIFSPNEAQKPVYAKYTCWDNKLHIRYRDFDRPEVISGFMDKLTYLITYVTNKKVLYETLNEADRDSHDFKAFWNKYVAKVYESNDFKTLVRAVKVSVPECEGIELSKNYRKNAYGEALLQFGSLKVGTYPADENDRGSLEDILREIFHFAYAGKDVNTYQFFTACELQQFLFDDRYTIELYEVDEVTSANKANQKYINKIDFKEEKKSFNELDLW